MAVCHNLISHFIIIFVKILVFIYDLISLPIFIIIQRPWIKWLKIKAPRAKQIKPGQSDSPWVSFKKCPKHFTDNCQTLDEVIEKVIQNNGRDKQCLGHREIIGEEVVYSEGKPITKYELSDYQWITYGQFEDRINNIGKGLLLNGVKSRQLVMIFADTSMDWFICAHSILKIGATVVTLYSSFNDEGIIHCMNETEVKHVLTSNQLLPKLIRLKNRIPKLSTIIHFNANNKTKGKSIENTLELPIKFIALSDLEERAELSTNNQQLTYQRPKGEDIAVLLYTSGTTGLPKGVQISHNNILNAMKGFRRVVMEIIESKTNPIYIAYLPLAHVFELMLENLFFILGGRLGYSSLNTLTDMGTAIKMGCKGDATLLKPDVMAAVPLVLDRIRETISNKINKKGIIVRKLFEFAIDYKSFWTQKGFDTPLMNRVFCKKFRNIFGANLSLMISGGAPLSQNTQIFIKSCMNINLIQGYGTSETSANGFAMDYFDMSFGRVGPPLVGTLIKLTDYEEGGYKTTDKPNPRGEIEVCSGAVSSGYYKLDKDNKESFYTDPEGRHWFRSGDIGEVFPNGTFKIIDRKKDLIKLQFGEYVALGKIESELKSNEFVDNICVFGNSYHNYLLALIVPNLSSLISLAKHLKLDYNSMNDLYENQRIIEFITNEIRKQGISCGLNKYENPQKIILCSDVWTPDNGLLTAAMKLKRINIIRKYQEQIDLLYT